MKEHRAKEIRRNMEKVYKKNPEKVCMKGGT
jgi:hypothetical protein